MKKRGCAAVAADWKKIKTAYITGDESYRALAARFDVPFRTIADRAKKEGWVARRAKHRERIVTRACRAEEKNEGQKLARMCRVADKLTGILERASDEAYFFERVPVTDDKGRPVLDAKGKPKTMETVNAREFRALVAATKDLTEIVRNVYELPLRQQVDQTVEVRLEGELEEYGG